MKPDEINGRLAALEAVVVRLLEIEGRKILKDEGAPALNELFFSLQEAVHARTLGMPPSHQTHAEHSVGLMGGALMSALAQR